MRLFALLLMGAVSLTACETTLEIELPNHDSVLVVNSLFYAGETWRVEVSRSVGNSEAGTYQPPVLGYATVEVWMEGALLETLRPVKDTNLLQDTVYHYVGNTTPEPGKTYTLKARASGLEPVEATATLPLAPRSPKVQVLGSPSRYETEVRVRVEDLPGDTYFVLFVEQGFDRGDGQFEYYLNSFSSNDPVFRRTFVDDFAPDDGTYFTRGYFTDALLEEDVRDITIRVEGADFSGFGRVVRIGLAAASKDYYDYTGTRDLQDQSRDNPFAEKVDVYSNVRGGLGIFAGASAVVVDVPAAGSR